VNSLSNGREAFEAFKEGAYDIVMMDLEMPVMNGIDACKEMRKWEKEKGLPPKPILALTAHAFVEESTKCLQAGFNEHLSKPIKKKNLLRVIGKYGKIIQSNGHITEYIKK